MNSFIATREDQGHNVVPMGASKTVLNRIHTFELRTEGCDAL